MEFKDYYKIMGVPRDATEAQIKQSYRRLARKYHPDVSKEKDAEARFKEVGEAYEVLRSPEKRAAYDQLGQGPRPGEDFRPPPDWGAGFEFSGAGSSGSDYSDFFESLFGGAGRGDGRAFHAGRSQDHHAKVMLDLDASLRGGARQFSLRVPELDAEGRLVSKERVLSVQVPKGILAGQSIRLAGQGARAPGSEPAGDLYIEVEFQPHPLYRVDGRDLYLELPVAPWEAALGATVKAPTPSGTVDLKIPPGSHAGSKLRLRGRGIPANPPGDLYALLQIVLPDARSDKARAAYAALAEALPFDPRAHLGA
ncbi:MAG TPA: DnaJ C-terminal domain-containing protein [Steroidobacteraceae bacterium]|jgi:curved DNA-binding protein|nr:DnaJ C-terminal domain-containing protein [Steroidobacteraceae bacterium]